MARLQTADISLSDIRRVVEKLRRYVDRYPALQELIDRLPENLGDLDLPGADVDDDALSATLVLQTGELVGTIREALVQAGTDVVRVGGPGYLFLLAAKTAKIRSRAARKEVLQASRGVFQERVDEATDLYLDGSIDRTEWLRRVREEVKDLHVQAAVSGRGGRWDDMRFSDWGRVGQKVREQYGYADNFARELIEKDYSAAQIKNRLSLYADAASSSFEAGYVADKGVDPSVLGYFPGDGTTDCRTRCKCRWSIRILNKSRGDFDATWRLGSAEHCRTCTERARRWRRIKVRNGSLVEPLPPIVSDR